MIGASKAGLPVNIKDVPDPPQILTNPKTFEAKIDSDGIASMPVTVPGE